MPTHIFLWGNDLRKTKGLSNLVNNPMVYIICHPFRMVDRQDPPLVLLALQAEA